VEEIGSILEIGVEKVALNSVLFDRPELLTAAARRFGSQSLVASIDARRAWPFGVRAYSHGGTRRRGVDPVEHSKAMQDAGAGEILLTSIDREGSMTGYDLALIRSVTEAVGIPVIASGGAGSVEDFRLAVEEGGADAVAAGSYFVFEGPHRAVLISYPDEPELRQALEPALG
jgi:cyclase